MMEIFGKMQNIIQTTTFEDILKVQEKRQITLKPVQALTYPIRHYSSEEIDEFFALDDQISTSLEKQGILKNHDQGSF